MRKTIQHIIMATALMGTQVAMAQQVVSVGKGSYASYTPLSYSYSADHPDAGYGFRGDKSRYMQTRKLNLHERVGQPIPTNDWWTNMINADDTHYDFLTGHLWSYPQYVEAAKYGVAVQQPRHWIDNGTEMKGNTRLKVGGLNFAPQAAVAQRWHDWDVAFSLQDGNKLMYVTMAHGVPFTWVETRNIIPTVSIENSNNGNLGGYNPDATVRLTDDAGTEIAPNTTRTLSAFVMEKGGEVYGVYLPTDTKVTVNADATATLHFSSGQEYIVVAVLNSAADLTRLADYVYSVVRDTKVTWRYDAAAGKLRTTWKVTADDLRDGKGIPDMGDDNTAPAAANEPVLPDDGGIVDVGIDDNGWDGPARAPRYAAGTAKVLQGFLPHHYRDYHVSDKISSIDLGISYATPHGKLRLCEGDEVEIDYDFNGMLPYYALPVEDDYEGAPFDDLKMTEMLRNYANSGSFGDDTYWGGKGLTQMALYMMFAREMGNQTLFRQCRDRLKEVLVNWLTYTPGEKNYFFARYDRWGAMVGYATSFDSDTFNDHHFHYGYFTYAAALLALVDDDFKKNYGEMITLVAKDYANWDREDTNFPFFRTLDPWAGHSFAGGMGDGNGNGQESTSEAMQGWGGLYLLGVALGNDAMRDAGIFGWITESRGTAEYWFDRHNDSKTGKVGYHTAASDDYNINYDNFKFDSGSSYAGQPIPYNSNLTCHGVGYWTYFGGDPVFVQGIQWMPISPALDYLAEDKAFAKWDYDKMWTLREHGDWTNSEGREAWLGNSDWGNVALSYLQHSDPEQAARIFDQGWTNGYGTFKTSVTNGITYFVTHSHLTTGDIDWSTTASIPTARTYKKGDGTKTYVAYNPTDAEITVTYSDGGKLTVPARQMAVSGRTSVAVKEIVTEETIEDPRDEVGMENLALNKDVTASGSENADSSPEKAVDGKDNTRWGSEKADGQWIAVDLGEKVKLYRLRIVWEAAYASKYDVMVSADGVNWTKAQSVVSSGGTDLVAMNDVEARHVKILCTQRANSGWGISIYELEAYGQRLSAKDTDLLGLKVEADQPTLTQYQETQLKAKGLTCGLQWTDVTVSYTSRDGQVTENGKFTPRRSGTATVEATSGSITVSKQLPVEEVFYVRYLEMQPRSAQVAVGDALSYTITGKDQFSGDMNPNKDNLSFRVCTYEVIGTWIDKNDYNKEKNIYRMTDTDKGSYDKVKNQLVINKAGVYAVIVNGVAATDTVFVSASDFTDVNLALNKPVTATSENGDSKAARTVDGDETSRWESQWGSDNQSVTIDLQAFYIINKVNVKWEAASAKEYKVQVSVDGSTWTDVKTKTGTGARWDNNDFSETKARFVRIQGMKREMEAYGYSIYEIQVYGTRKEGDAPSLLVDLGEDDVTKARLLSGTWEAEAFSRIDADAEATAYDLRQVSVPEGTSFDTSNPNALVIVSAEQHAADAVTNSQNVVTAGTDGSYTACNLAYLDAVAPNTELSIAADNVTYLRAEWEKYTTLVLPFDCAPGDGLRVFELTGVEETDDAVILMTSEVTVMKANVPYVILNNTEGAEQLTAQNVQVAFTEGSVTKEMATLTATYTQHDPSTTDYEMDGLALEPATAPFAPFHPYWTLVGVPAGKTVTLSVDGQTTGVTLPTADRAWWTKDDAVYDLQGRRVERPTGKGIYIIKGKKVVMN